MPDSPPTPLIPPSPLTAALAAAAPFALVRREGSDMVELFTGELSTAPTLARIPLPPGPGPRTLALVPYRQVTERGFAFVDDQAPLECLRITGYHRLPYRDVIAELQREIDLFGRSRRVGFYATYTALAATDRIETRYGSVQLCRDPADRSVHALRGETFAGVQFHPESVLTEDGLEILADLVTPLVPGLAPAGVW